MQPTLSLLDLARGLHIAVGDVHETKPLCENIFDVPRSELLETYERLRDVFWKDPVGSTASSTSPKPALTPTVPAQAQVQQVVPVTTTTTTTITGVAATTTPPPQLPRKRCASESPEPYSKQHKLVKREYTHKEMMASSVLSSTQTMWGYKKWFIQHLRRSEQDYKEETILVRLSELEVLLTPVDKRNLAQYLQPVLVSLGRRNTRVDAIFTTWLMLASSQQQQQQHQIIEHDLENEC